MVANNPKEDLIQWSADRSRALKAGVRNGDDEAVAIVLGQIAERFGEAFAERVFTLTVSRMIDDENFSFVPDDAAPTT